MRETEDECWKLLNRELRDARAMATTREKYPQRTRFDQPLYDQLAAEAGARYRARTEERRRRRLGVPLPIETSPTEPQALTR